MRRQKQFLITGEKLLSLHLKKEGLNIPDDARIRGVRYNPFRDLIEFVVESDEYPEVDEGAEPEVML
uniref:Uncharacterized protein n=1 Tax=viral metagenome TaxID=1070528 RepID=A0A6M3X4B4_9ZZZZ